MSARLARCFAAKNHFARTRVGALKAHDACALSTCEQIKASDTTTTMTTTTTIINTIMARVDRITRATFVNLSDERNDSSASVRHHFSIKATSTKPTHTRSAPISRRFIWLFPLRFAIYEMASNKLRYLPFVHHAAFLLSRKCNLIRCLRS